MRSKVKKVAVTCMLATVSLVTPYAWAQSAVGASASALGQPVGENLTTAIEHHQCAFIAADCGPPACLSVTKPQLTKSSDIYEQIAEQAFSPFAAQAPRAHRR